ncbi:VanZ family protein [Cytobacillus gottheilii]|uniref:VanZ family protein n=1 Tax=Cytobacillus gottheilii TaxID=859144 RepID=UPI0009BAE553|nr:VanZ family protein [Cytobacillus gottheilii]
MDKKIEAYIDKIVKQLNCDEEEKREIKDEMSDHLNLLQQEYIDQGYSNPVAVQKAIESFGEEKQLTNGLQASIFPFHKIFMRCVWVVFLLYSFAILFILLMQRISFVLTDYFINGDTFNRYVFDPIHSDGYLEYLKWNSNIIPFKNTLTYITGSDHFNMDIIINNTIGNILIFLPLGVFLPILFRRYNRFTKILAAAAIISFTIEVLQIALQLGQFDIDDVILNTLGAIFGFFAYKLIRGIVITQKGRESRKILY